MWAWHSGLPAPDPGCPFTAAPQPGHIPGKKQGPRPQPAPARLPLPPGCWNSQEGLNKSKLIAGDSFGPNSMTELGNEEVET